MVRQDRRGRAAGAVRGAHRAGVGHVAGEPRGPAGPLPGENLEARRLRNDVAGAGLGGNVDVYLRRGGAVLSGLAPSDPPYERSW